MNTAVKFPDTPTFTGINAPSRIEADLHGLEVVQGEVPPDLNGTFYRCTHDPAMPPMLGDDIYVNGDGMISMFRLQEGRVDFKSRYVRTDRFVAQEKAGRSLFGVYRNRYTNDPSVPLDFDLGTANTTPVWHGRKLLALKEDSHPWQVDPDTLETVGKWSFDGALTAASMTAHPKVDWAANELLFFSYMAKGDATTDVAFYIADKDGKIVHEVWFNAPYPCFVHDFVATEEHVVFPFFPLLTDLDVLKQGGPFYQWDGTLESHFAVLPRRGGADEIRWFKGPTAFAAHMMNGFTEGDKVHLDLCLSEALSFPFFPNKDGAPFDRAKAAAKLVRLTFDLSRNSEEVEQKVLFPELCEMPRTDERYQTRKYRHGYLIFHDSSRPTTGQGGTTGMLRNSIGHLDLETGALDAYHIGPGKAVQEPVFAPRYDGAPEGDGYLLAVVSHIEGGACDLVILDARKVGDGPVATVRLPLHQRPAAHGAWIPQSALESGLYS